MIDKITPQKPEQLSINGRPPKVLIIDDDSFISGIYVLGLERAGCAVAVFQNGREAIVAAENDPPDIILCDLMMPEIDGFETLILLKKNNKLKDIPVLVLSSLSQKEDAERAKELGAYGYLKKTEVLPKDCITKVKKALNI